MHMLVQPCREGRGPRGGAWRVEGARSDVEAFVRAPSRSSLNEPVSHDWCCGGRLRGLNRTD